MGHTMGRAEVKEIVLPYNPRQAFMPFHNRRQRWACLVAHRRAGKTVAAVNDIIRAAITYQGQRGLFGYVAPYRSQAKAVAWQYFQEFAAPITEAKNEQELTLTLVNGSQIRLFGADNADAMRGLGFDGLYLDEYGDFKPSVFGNVLRPSLSDKQGWCVFGGTPKGRNQFYDIFTTAERLPHEWFLLRLPASSSGLLPKGELNAAKAQLSPDQYQQEYECDFSAAILGAFFGTEMREAEEQGRITRVEYDRNLPVYTAWDLGYRDDTAIWFYQVTRNEIRVIDFYAVSGANIHDIADVVLAKPYQYVKHYLPHDARAKSLQTGKSIVEQLAVHLDIAKLSVVPDIGVQSGIQAVRLTLPRVWFDAEKCRDGIEALRQYQREYDEDKKAFRQNPRHDWTSHPSDAFRMLAVSWAEVTDKSLVAEPRPLMVGPQNTVTLNDMWAVHDRQGSRRARI
jgi:phage terminase large subunit